MLPLTSRWVNGAAQAGKSVAHGTGRADWENGCRTGSEFEAAGQIDATLEADKVIQSCDMATELGHYALKITPKGGGNPIEDNGKFVVTWRKVGGQWRAIADIFNSDRPAK